MKKIHLLLTVVLLAASLFGCGKTEKNKEEVNTNVVEQYNVHKIENYNEDTQPFWNTNYHVIAKAEGGYYYQNSSFLYFYDIVTEEVYPVCSKPNCTHEKGAGCEAYYGQKDADIEWIDNNVYFYKDFIYIISKEGDIVRVSPDGHEKSILAKNAFTPTDLIGECLTFSGDYVYAYNMNEHFVTEGTYVEKITRYSLSDKSVDVIYEYEGEKSAISALKAYGNQMFFLIQTFEQVENDGKKMWTRNAKGLYGFDTDTGEIGLLFDENISDYSVDVNNNYIYYLVKNDGIYRYDIETKDTKRIVDVMEYELYSGNMSCDGKYIYVSNPEKNNNDMCVFDSEGNNITTISRVNCPGSVIFGDEEYLIEMLLDENSHKSTIKKIDKKQPDSWQWK